MDKYFELDEIENPTHALSYIFGRFIEVFADGDEEYATIFINHAKKDYENLKNITKEDLEDISEKLVKDMEMFDDERAEQLKSDYKKAISRLEQ